MRPGSFLIFRGFLCFLLFRILFGSQWYPYEENKGQLGSFYHYRTILGKGVLLFHPSGYRAILFHPDSFPSDPHVPLSTLIPYHIVDIEYRNGKSDTFQKEHRSPDYFNYFLGNDPNYWATRVHHYQKIGYQNLYPGIDLLWDITDEGFLKTTWLISPNANPQQIQIVYKGNVRLVLHPNGDLEIVTSVGSFWEKAPHAYQKHEQKTIPVACHFSLINDSTVTFQVGNYDPTSPLYIDPTLIFSTFTGSYLDNWGFTATYDNQGNLYSGGIVSNYVSSPPYTFPTSPGAYQIAYAGGSAYSFTNDNLFYPSDIAIIKFNATGTNRIWATLIGGSNNEQPHSLIANANQELYVLGATRSSNFPVTLNAYDPTFNGAIDIVLVKLSSDGTQLLASTFVGAGGIDGVQLRTGNPLYHFYADDGRGEIELDPYGNVWIVTSTLSNGLPTTPNALKNTLSGIQDGYLMKWDPNLSQLLYASYIGGSGLDALYNLEYDLQSQRIVVVGGTTSFDLPTSPTALFPTYQGGAADGFILTFDTALTLLSGTYFGGSSYDQIYHGEISPSGYLYIAGQTLSGLTPTPGSNSVPNGNLFFAKLPLTLDTVLILKRFGDSNTGSVELTFTSFLVDICSNIYFSGWGGLLGNGSTSGLPVTPNAIQSTTDGKDFYFAAFDSTLSVLQFASYFGGPGIEEHVDGGTSRFDPKGVIYQAICGGCGGSSGAPTTPGAWSPTNNSPNCNNMAVKMAFDILSSAKAQASFSITSSMEGCAPYTVAFQNFSTNADSFLWDFGDGTFSTLPNPVHIFTTPNVYTVILYASSSTNPCILPDTATLTITVYQSKGADFGFPIVCDSLTVPFQNQTDSALFYLWDFGDGDTSTEVNPVHTYAQPGYYSVSLITNPGSLCSDTVTKVVPVPVTLPATFNMDTLPCVKETHVSLLDTTYLTSATWIFDATDTIQAVETTYTFPSYGPHQITLIRESFGYCSDTASVTFQIDPPAVASFSLNLVDSCRGEVILFNTSQNADSFFWDLGDNTQFFTASLVPLSHQYQTPGYYSIMLIAQPHLPTCADTIVDTPYIPRKALAIWDTMGPECSLTLLLSAQNSIGNHFSWYINGTWVSDSMEFFYSFPESDSYQITLVTFDSAFSCSDTSTRILFIGNTSRAQFSVSDLLCNPTVRFRNESVYDTSKATPPIFRWELSDGTVYQDSIHLTHTFPDTGQYTVLLIVRPGTLCEARDSQRIQIRYLPPPTFTIEKIPCQPRFQLINTSSRGDSAFWELDDGFVAYTWNAVTPIYPTGGIKRIVLHIFEVNQGCESIKDTLFYYSPVAFSKVFIPNVFTPNGDGLNDRFEIIGEEAICFRELAIFDRWGNLIHQSRSPSLWWDGTHQGQPAPEGVYVYLLKSDEGITRVGTVTLLR